MSNTMKFDERDKHSRHMKRQRKFHICICVHMSTYIYMYDRVLSHNKEMLSFVTKWMSLKDIKSSEINQTQNDKCWMMLLLLGK